MRSFFTFLFFVIVSGIQAQKNVFLDRAYWKSSPDIAKVQADIASGNDPSAFNNNAFDPTVFAILEQAPNATIKFLLTQKGNDPNKITHDQRTYIFWAAYKGNTDLMEHLLKLRAKVNLRDDKGYTPLSFAASSGQTNTAVYDLCIREGADLKNDLDLEGANALLLAAPFDTDFSLMSYFISKGADLNSQDANGNTAFNYAAKAGNIPFLKMLVEKGVKYNDNAMLMASKGTRGHANTLDVFQFLESLQLRPTVLGKNGENALHAIVTKEKQSEIINYFISKGVDVNQPDEEGNTAFMNAASSNNDVSIVEMLVQKVKNINQVNKKGVSALAMAVRNNSPEVVEVLLRYKANVKLADSDGNNLACYLMQSYNPKKKDSFNAKLTLLNGAGFKIEVPQQNGNTLYHLAVEKKDLSLIELVENFKVDINAQNKEGLTALHKAALISDDVTILRYLISKGANKGLRTGFKETAFDIASENETFTKNNISLDFLK